MTRMTRLDYAVMRNLINTYTHTDFMWKEILGRSLLCAGAVPHVQSELSCALQAHPGTKLLEDLRNQESNTKK